MIGYHFTSYTNWLKIKEEGLKCLPIHKPEVEEKTGLSNIKGIWVWKHKLKKEDEMGSVLWQITTKADKKVVQLEVRYEDILRAQGWRIVEMSHTGNIGNLLFHKSEPKAYISVKDIPAKDIRLVKIYDLMDLIK